MSATTQNWISDDTVSEFDTPECERLPIAVTEVSMVGLAVVFWAGIFWSASSIWSLL